MKRMVYLNSSYIREGIKLAVAAAACTTDGESPGKIRILRHESEVYVLMKVDSCAEIIDAPYYIYIFRGNEKEMVAVRQKVVNSNIKILIEEYIDDHISLQNVNGYDYKKKGGDTQRKYDGSLGKLRTPHLHSGPSGKWGWRRGMMLMILCFLFTIVVGWKNIDTCGKENAAMVNSTVNAKDMESAILCLLMVEDIENHYKNSSFENLAATICAYLLTEQLGVDSKTCEQLRVQVGGCRDLKTAAGHFHPGENRICIKTLENSSGRQILRILFHESYHYFQYSCLIQPIEERIEAGEILLEQVALPMRKWIAEAHDYKSVEKDGIEAYHNQEIEKSAYRFGDSMLAYYEKLLSSQ